MEKITLSELQLLYDFKPKILKVNNEDLKSHILSHQPFNSKEYIELNYHQQVHWFSDYYSELYKLDYDFIIFQKANALILKSGESLELHNHIDRWDLKNQPDLSCLYTISQGKKESSIIFEYDNNRFVDKKWTIRIENNKIIMFNSTLNHKITTNENDEDLILLSIQYQFLNG
tara:strand:- start:1875 stop:2393 length:519 start_codon:yes stop_codon:yes gene_type:complete